MGDLSSILGVGKIPWRRERLPTVFWPGEFHGLYGPWGHKESDMTELQKRVGKFWGRIKKVHTVFNNSFPQDSRKIKVVFKVCFSFIFEEMFLLLLLKTWHNAQNLL